ncbi:hypothetical protein B0H11DRAFT_2243679 [Mycena galericulata]|nr:hypothetical protein B0H11DRAFT_2243679 [Mycena galericulata]
MSTKFALTPAHVSSLMDPLVAGDPGPFGAAIDPEVHWIIGSEKKDPERLTGVSNVASWLQEVNAPLYSRLTAPPKMFVDSFVVVGNTAIFLTFSEETGKIVKIREYLDTALVQEVMQTN